MKIFRKFLDFEFESESNSNARPPWSFPPPHLANPRQSSKSPSRASDNRRQQLIPSSEASKTNEGGSALEVISKFYGKGPQPISDPPASPSQANSVKIVSEGPIDPTLSKAIDAYFADDQCPCAVIVQLLCYCVVIVIVAMISCVAMLISC